MTEDQKTVAAVSAVKVIIWTPREGGVEAMKIKTTVKLKKKGYDWITLSLSDGPLQNPSTIDILTFIGRMAKLWVDNGIYIPINAKDISIRKVVIEEPGERYDITFGE